MTATKNTIATAPAKTVKATEAPAKTVEAPKTVVLSAELRTALEAFGEGFKATDGALSKLCRWTARDAVRANEEHGGISADAIVKEVAKRLEAFGDYRAALLWGLENKAGLSHTKTTDVWGVPSDVTLHTVDAALNREVYVFKAYLEAKQAAKNDAKIRKQTELTEFEGSSDIADKDFGKGLDSMFNTTKKRIATRLKIVESQATNSKADEDQKNKVIAYYKAEQDFLGALSELATRLNKLGKSPRDLSAAIDALE